MFEMGFTAIEFDLLVPLGYVGPGAGLSMLGALFAVGVLFLFALLSPVLYVVRLVRSFWSRESTQLQIEIQPSVSREL